MPARHWRSLHTAAMQRLVLLLLAALLSACATPANDPRLVPGRSTVAEARAIYGKVTRIWPDAGGGQTLEYSQQPYGEHCYMLSFDAEGRLLTARDGLAPNERSRVQPGMSMEQVERMLGRELSRVAFSRSGEEVWDWNITPPGGFLLRFNVFFKEGRVVRTAEILIDTDRRHPYR